VENGATNLQPKQTARAAAQTGNQSAALTAYAALIEQWKQADTNLSELREARDYLKQAKR